VKINVTYVSIWDSGSEVRSDAKLDIETGKIIDIESVDMDGLCVLNSENIVVRLGSMTKVCEVIQDNDGDYAISTDDLNIIRNSCINSKTQINWEEFVNNYMPVRNHLNESASFDGTMFETFGEELEFIQQEDNKRACWTLVEENGKTWIEFGYRVVNRLGYFITTHLPLNPNIHVLIEDRKQEHIKSLVGKIEQVLNDFVSEEPLDGDEVDALIIILKIAINMHEGNINMDDQI